MKRRAVLAAVAAAGSGGCLRLTRNDGDPEATATPTGTDADSGAESATASATAAPDQPPETGWTFRTQAPVTGTPRRAGDTIYVASSDRRLYALRAATGDRRWKTEVGEPDGARPRVVDGTVLVTTGRGLFAIDEAEGEVRWRANRSGGPLARAPPVADGVVVTSDGGGLAGLDVASGERRWTTDLPEADGVRGVAPDDGRLYAFGLTDDNRLDLHEVTPATGEVAGTTTLATDARPHYARFFFAIEGTAITDLGERITGFDAGTGERAWTVERAEGARPHATVHDGALYVKTLAASGADVFAVDARTGERRWEASLGSGQCCHAAPAATDAAVYAPNMRGDTSLAALDDAGDVRWRYDAEVTVTATPVVDPDRGTVVFGADDGRVYRLVR